MSIWQAAEVDHTSPSPEGRVDLPGDSSDSVRVLAPQFVLNDGADYVVIGFGVKVIDNP